MSIPALETSLAGCSFKDKPFRFGEVKRDHPPPKFVFGEKPPQPTLPLTPCTDGNQFFGLTEEDQKHINEFCDDEDFPNELEMFEDEFDLACMQPTNPHGLFIVEPRRCEEEAVITEDWKKESGYFIGEFIGGSYKGQRIYIPAQPGTFNARFNVGDKVIVTANNTPGCLMPWRSTRVKEIKEAITTDTFVLNLKTHKNPLGAIIGRGGCVVKSLCEESLRQPSRAPRITYELDGKKLTVSVTGQLANVDVAYIKRRLLDIIQSI